MAERPHIELQVLPLEAGHHAALGGSLILMDFPDGPDMAYLQGVGTSGELVSSPQTVRRYATLYDHLIIKSLPPDGSRELIRTTMEGRYRCPPPVNSN